MAKKKTFRDEYDKVWTEDEVLAALVDYVEEKKGKIPSQRALKKKTLFLPEFKILIYFYQNYDGIVRAIGQELERRKEVRLERQQRDVGPDELRKMDDDMEVSEEQAAQGTMKLLASGEPMNVDVGLSVDLGAVESEAVTDLEVESIEVTEVAEVAADIAKEAAEANGVKDAPIKYRKRTTDEEKIAMLREYILELGRLPTVAEINKKAEDGVFPTYQILRRALGPKSEWMKLCGIAA